jgi:hypothetical protein
MSSLEKTQPGKRTQPALDEFQPIPVIRPSVGKIQKQKTPLVRAGLLFGFDTRTITPAMVTPFQTSGGAQVLAPEWEAINPLLLEMFGQ